MAERRMFSIKIIDSDDFLDLPLEAQSLYFHLAMRADDDGFINSPKKLVRAIGASADDMKMLEDKKFIIVFDSGIVAIRHWKVHNSIKKDRYKASIFFEEKKQLICDENGTYLISDQSIKDTEPKWSQSGTRMEPEWSQNGSKVEPQVSIGKDSIGKDSIGKDRLGKDSKEKERIEKVSLGEGSINTSPTPSGENKNEDFYFNGACALADKAEKLTNDESHFVEALEETETQNSTINISENINATSGNDGMAGHADQSSTLYRSENATGGYDGDASADWAVSPSQKVDKPDALKPVRGPYGRGIVCLTDGQLTDLKERLGENQLNRYMDKLATFIYDKGARIKSHYDTLLKWYEEDSAAEKRSEVRQLTSQHPSSEQSSSSQLPLHSPTSQKPAANQQSSSSEKRRYGSFSTDEAFQAALKRTFGDDYDRFF